MIRRGSAQQAHDTAITQHNMPSRVSTSACEPTRGDASSHRGFYVFEGEWGGGSVDRSALERGHVAKKRS